MGDLQKWPDPSPPMTSGLYDYIEGLETQLTKVRELLKVAHCPDAQCNDGVIPHGPDPDGFWEAEQCQWCDEQSAALVETGGDDDLA